MAFDPELQAEIANHHGLSMSEWRRASELTPEELRHAGLSTVDQQYLHIIDVKIDGNRVETVLRQRLSNDFCER